MDSNSTSASKRSRMLEFKESKLQSRRERLRVLVSYENGGDPGSPFSYEIGEPSMKMGTPMQFLLCYCLPS